MLDKIKIILCETTHPGNIGAAARAMKTMGLSKLRLILPKSYPSAEATARASGADDLLAKAEVFEDFDTAIADCQLVLGTSARLRNVTLPQYDARQAAQKALGSDFPVALVFGQERSGLTNQHMSRCHALVHIPTNPEYGSLNLAAGVQVLCYEMRMAALAIDQSELRAMPAHQPAEAQAVYGLYQHLEESLLKIGFLNPDQSTMMMLRLKALFNRAQPDKTEINILRGILSKLDKNN